MMHGPEDDNTSLHDFLGSRDEFAFRRLYREYTPTLFQFVFRLVGRNQADSEDIVQETWIRAIAGLEKFRRDSSFRTWLTGIAMNLCRELFRSRSKNRGITESLEQHNLEDRSGEGLDLELAIASLPGGYRAVLVLHDVEGYTHEEIAALLEIDAGTSKSQLSRARKAVRQELGRLYSKEFGHETT